MRTQRVIPILIVFLLAACGGSGLATPTRPAATGAPASTGGQAPTGAPAGKVDCAAIVLAAESMVGLQLLTQLTTPATVESIRSAEIGHLDLEAMLSGLHDLHALDAYSSPLGDPKAAIDLYEKAATAAKVLFAMDPITQGAIDAFNTENIGTVTDFLGHQVAISGAIDKAGC